MNYDRANEDNGHRIVGQSGGGAHRIRRVPKDIQDNVFGFKAKNVTGLRTFNKKTDEEIDQIFYEENAKTPQEIAVQETEINKRKMEIMDEIEEQLKEEKRRNYIQDLADQSTREEQAELKIEYEKQINAIIGDYEQKLKDNFASYEDVLEAITAFSNGNNEKNSLILVFDGRSHGSKMLFYIIHNGKITNPKQIQVVKS